jgi:hypothetical protein
MSERKEASMFKRICSGAILAVVLSITVVRATPGSGCTVSPRFCVTPVARFTTDANIKIQAPGLGKVDSQPGQLTDVAVATVVGEPGGFSGWHSHPGPAYVTVTGGEIEVYEADDPTCTPMLIGGEGQPTAFLEQPGHVHYVRSVGAVNYTSTAMFLLPVGAPLRTDEPSPGNCPF